MKFSQSLGITPIRVDLQRDSMDKMLRNKLWAIVCSLLFEDGKGFFCTDEKIAKDIWINQLGEPIDDFFSSSFNRQLKKIFFNDAWHEVFDLIQEIINHLNSLDTEGTLSNKLNNVLESEMSAYRLINDQFAEITDRQEIIAIEKALDDSSVLDNVHTHLSTALSMWSDRENPNYRNSVKESISAVEAICQIITGDDKATLGKALHRLKSKGVEVHGSMVEGWSKLYGYTSDHGGIRHALSDGQDVDSATAQYMLVSCSAFVSYLIKISQNAGINLK
jgi:AbiJ N-terminal domain 4